MVSYKILRMIRVAAVILLVSFMGCANQRMIYNPDNSPLDELATVVQYKPKWSSGDYRAYIVRVVDEHKNTVFYSSFLSNLFLTIIKKAGQKNCPAL
mgnify:CR=1 FL=1